MTERKISFNIFRTLNLGNYENIKIDAGIEETLGPNETYAEGYARLWNEVNSALDLAIETKLGELFGEKKTEIKQPEVSNSRFRVPVVSE